MRYVALEDSEWCALFGFRSARLGQASDDVAAAFWPLVSLALGSNRAV